MRAREHVLAGVTATTITYVAASAATGEPVTLQGILTAAALGVPAGLDFFEPPIHPHHRGVCHSQAAACGLGLVASRIWNDPCIGQTQRPPARRILRLIRPGTVRLY
jgi:hypothetical protein